jgi:dCMP deaminase
MGLALLTAERSTCVRRHVGCVAISYMTHEILAVGYNGVPSGYPHCAEVRCLGAGAKSGERLDECRAIHAEQNVLMWMKDTKQPFILYCTTMPCITCAKMLCNTGCKFVYYLDPYPSQESDVSNLFKACGIQMLRLE